MRVYYTASYSYADKNHQLLDDIAGKIKVDGHTLIKRPFKPDDMKTLNKEVGKIFDFSQTDINQTYKNMIKRIRESDVVIAEVTSPSNSIGYEIATAQNEKKPVLAIFNSTVTDRLANFFQGNDSKLFKVSPYKNADEAADTIREFIEEAKNMVDTKFILIISPEIDKYLTWAADERRMHKAQVVRTAVEEMMGKDKDYKAFLKSQGLD